jgi:hypothetical protein
MALELSIYKYGINDAGTKITVKDYTGNYNADSNPTGYGAPNAERSSLALFLRAVAKRYDGEDDITDTILTITETNPDKLVADTWYVDLLSKDSWIQAIVYGLRLYASPSSLAFDEGELTYDVDSNEIRKITSRTGDGPYTYTYETVEESALDDESNTKAYETILNTYAIPNLCECVNKANKRYFSAKEKEEVDFRRYQEFKGTLVGIKNDFGFGNYAEAQKTIEYLENKCDCFTEECNC